MPINADRYDSIIQLKKIIESSADDKEYDKGEAFTQEAVDKVDKAWKRTECAPTLSLCWEMLERSLPKGKMSNTTQEHIDRIKIFCKALPALNVNLFAPNFSEAVCSIANTVDLSRSLSAEEILKLLRQMAQCLEEELASLSKEVDAEQSELTVAHLAKWILAFQYEYCVTNDSIMERAKVYCEGLKVRLKNNQQQSTKEVKALQKLEIFWKNRYNINVNKQTELGEIENILWPFRSSVENHSSASPIVERPITRQFSGSELKEKASTMHKKFTAMECDFQYYNVMEKISQLSSICEEIYKTLTYYETLPEIDAWPKRRFSQHILVKLEEFSKRSDFTEERVKEVWRLWAQVIKIKEDMLPQQALDKAPSRLASRLI